MSFEDDLRNDPKTLAKQYSFYPNNPSYTEWSFGDSQVDKTSLSGPYVGFNRINVKRDYLIAKVRLELGMTDRGQSLIVKPTFDQNAAGVSVYFLPWDNRGAAVRMRIPDRDPAKPEHEHPKVFFTAVLSGCSIVFKGTPQNPTIYHCGTEGGVVGTPTTGNSNDFFRNMLTGPGYRPIGGQIKSTEYMIPKVGSAGVEDLQSRFFEALQNQRHRRNGVIVKDVLAWGACFGIRSGRDWKFYLQKNATIRYTKIEEVTRDREIEKKAFLGTKTKTIQYVTTKVTEGNRVAKPIELQKVFPGVGMAKLTGSWNLVEL